ncbi:MAG: DUF2064 domain-containing protein, partial [Planctomycetota bacterium]
MIPPTADRPRFLVMAKPPVPGQVKTRLTTKLSAEQAAAVHAAMFAALVARLDRFVQAQQASLILALAVPDDQLTHRSAILDHAFRDHPDARDTLTAADLTLVSQGTGPLGQRIAHAWPDQSPAVVLGVDSPDLPESHFQAALVAAAPPEPATCSADHQPPDAAIGPTGDGGYWTLAAPPPPPPPHRGNPPPPKPRGPPP